MLSDEEEILDLVNACDDVVGTITHAQVYDWKNFDGNFIRASNAFLVSNEGKLWIPRRQPHKKIAPNGLDFSMGEHVQAGESYIDAAVRGFQEELRLTVKAEQLIEFGIISPSQDIAPYFTHNYILFSDTDPDFEPNDFSSAEWIDPNDLISRLEAGENSKTSLLPTVKMLLDYLRQNSRD